MISKEEFIEQILDDIIKQKKKPSFKERCLIKDLKKERNANSVISDLTFVLFPLWTVFSVIVAVILCIHLRVSDNLSIVVFVVTLFVMHFPLLKRILAQLFLLNDILNLEDAFLERMLKKWGIFYATEYKKYGKFRRIFDIVKNGERKVFKINGPCPFYFQQKIGCGLEDNDADANVVRFYWKTEDCFDGEIFYYGEDPIKEGTELTVRHPVLCQTQKEYHFIAHNAQFANWNGLKDSLNRAQEIADAFKIKYEDCIFKQIKNEVFFDVKMTLNEAFWNPVWEYNKNMRSKKGLEKLYMELTILHTLAQGEKSVNNS